MGKRYEAAYEKVYKEYPLWKKQAIEEDCPRMTKQLAQEVIQLAESENENEWEFFYDSIYRNRKRYY